MATNFTQSPRQYEQDCHILHSYISGNVGAISNKELVGIFVNRDLNALKLVRQTYSRRYGQDLLQLTSNVQRNNSFARIACLRMVEPHERDAQLMRHSLFGGNLNLNTLIEILLAVLRSCRNYGSKADMSLAMCDAKTLYEALESGKTIDQKTIISVLSRRNNGQVRAILSSYKQLYGHEFDKSVKRSKCGQFGKELRVIIRCIQHPEKFFAKQLRMKKADGREILIRTVITRSGIDIKGINKAFATKTGSSLENLVILEFNTSKDKNSNIVAGILIGLIKGC
ncbi:RNA-binding CRS1 / YhbY domain protein isoform 1 [Hibiscus syriacus]|uniref:RNA-binding CRS1 / YhbY domain protein isoform 1 n=1 Tax=Hibiscus syriacus TaxID=106335 RepID=A0A6A3C0J3_HIBSY|nr:RNA-binding CRS1 / YhbY domain protein isoform 1 [Hibiscus syriacus]